VATSDLVRLPARKHSQASMGRPVEMSATPLAACRLSSSSWTHAAAPGAPARHQPVQQPLQLLQLSH
jgi:hypothetical protein